MTVITPPSDPAEAMSPPPVTAADLSRIIRRISHIFSAGDLGNTVTSDALSDLAEYLHGLGPTLVSELRSGKKIERKKKAPTISPSFIRMSLGELDAFLEKETLSKSTLIYIGRVRFGMPESRLRRLPTAEVVEAIKAAAAHEKSLDLIEKNAEVSGRARQS